MRLDDSKFKTSYFSKEKYYGWIIAANKPKMRDFLVCTTNEETRTEWMEAIKGVLKEREIHPVKRETILAGGLGTAKTTLSSSEEDEEEREDSTEKAYIKFLETHNQYTCSPASLRFRDTLKKSRDGIPRKQVEQQEEGLVRIQHHCAILS